MLARLTFSIAVIVSSLSFTSVPSEAARSPSHVTQHHVRLIHRPVVPWQIWLDTVRVHICEEPRWDIRGPEYSGGLGWTNSLWPKFKAPWMPANMADAKPLQQSWALAHFIQKDNHGYWPDQRGCNGY